MRNPLRLSVLAVVVGGILGASALPGCGDEMKTGSSVKDTPEAQAGRKASMDGMRAAMEKTKGGRAQSR